MNTMDTWGEVMKLAEKHGFITMAAGGVAILMCHEEQKKQGIFEKTQATCKRDCQQKELFG